MNKNGLISGVDKILNSKWIFKTLFITAIITFILIFILQTYENKKLKEKAMKNSDTHHSQSIQGGQN